MKKCDNCRLRKESAKAFDIHWHDEEDCPYNKCPVPDFQKTNADKLRAMTDEELAVVIAWPYLASPPWCAEHTTCPYISEDPTPCDKCALDWLRQEASDG